MIYSANNEKPVATRFVRSVSLITCFLFMSPFAIGSEQKLGSNIIATITLKNGAKVGAKCGFSEQIRTIEIHADGSGLDSHQSRGTSCSAPSSSNNGFTLRGNVSFPPQPFNLEITELDRLLNFLRSQQRNSSTRMASLSLSDEELHLSEQRQSLSISVLNDSIGSASSGEIIASLDVSAESAATGALILKEIAKLVVVQPNHEIESLPQL